MTKEHKRMIEKSLKQMRREEEVQEKISAIISGIITSCIFGWALFFA